MLKKIRWVGPATLVLSLSVTLSAVFALGVASGLYFQSRLEFAGGGDHEDHDHPHDEEDHPPEHEEEHVALTRQAFDNLDLHLGNATRGDYWRSVLVPAKVVEIPGRSNLSVSSPVTGVIEEVSVLPGESIAVGQRLFLIRITDQALADAQSELLTTLTQQDVNVQELARLEPLIQSGAVPGKRKRELEYELRQFESQKNALIQQLRGRGLPEEALQTLLDQRRLATTIQIGSPPIPDATDVAKETPGDRCEKSDTIYTIENMNVHPGKSIERGEALCSVAYHAELYIEGTAFESDLQTLEKIADRDWSIRVEFGRHRHEATDDLNAMEVRLLRIDNHVDPQSQTVRFFARLPNQVERSQQDGQGRHFQQWRFRPGQRVHLRLPVEKWQNQLTLPVEAVAVDGPNAVVFVEHHDEEDKSRATEDHAAMDDDPHHDVYIELEPAPVRLLHRDDKVAVIGADGEITPETRIALNHAYKLHLALKTQAGGGAGHHHHDH